MLLKSVPKASSISAPVAGATLADYCQVTNEVMPTETDPISRELFIRYGSWFKEQWVPELQQDMVEHVTADSDGFTVRTASGAERTTRSVVVASGVIPHAYVPPIMLHARRGEAKCVTHSSEHDDLSEFIGRRVAVIGAGQSALETAVLAAEAGAEVHVICRSDSLLWGEPPATSGWRSHGIFKPGSNLGPGWTLATMDKGVAAVHRLPVAARLELVHRILGPSGAWWMHRRFDAANIEVHTGAQVKAVHPVSSGVELMIETADQQNGEQVPLLVDHVIAATGFKVDIDRCSFLDESIRSRLHHDSGFPRLSTKFESTMPGLYFAGLPAAGSFGPLLRFVCGTSFCAPRVAASISQRVSHTAH
jgi:cation diffusion facilitator CzcD-associated flavoprotein CzcO